MKKATSRLLAVFLTFLLVLGLLPMSLFAASADDWLEEGSWGPDWDDPFDSEDDNSGEWSEIGGSEWDDDALTFSISQERAMPGDVVALEISVSPGSKSVSGLLLKAIQYDSSALEFLGFDDYGELVTTSLGTADSINEEIINLGYSHNIFPDGKICSAVFRVKDNAPEGDYLVSFQTAGASDNGLPVAFNFKEGAVTVFHWLPGDFNQDGVVNMLDAVHFIGWVNFSYIPDLYPMVYQGSKDFNKDGTVNMLDAVYFIGWINFPFIPGLYDIDWETASPIAPVASQGLAFVSNGDGTCYVSGIGECTDTDIVIPSVSPEGDRVTGIGERAFADCTDLTSVVIPDSVTSIGAWAFLDCTNLTSVVIPNSVTSIGYVAFIGCSSLTSITLPSSVTNMGERVFDFCFALESITVAKDNPVFHSAGNCLIETATGTLILGCKNSVIPTDGSVTSIEGRAFARYSSESLTIPDGVTSIGWEAFKLCSLTSVTIPASLTSIAQDAFDTFDLEIITVLDGNPVYHSTGNCLIETATGTLILGGKNSVIPDDGSVTSIGVDAFLGCRNLRSISIPDSVTNIEDRAFYYCTSLTSITIPASVTCIGWEAFDGCFNLTEIIFRGTEAEWDAIEKEDGWDYNTGNYTVVFQPLLSQGLEFVSNGDGTCYVAGIGSCTDSNIVIPSVSPDGDTVTGIGEDAFFNCTSLTSVVIPNSVTSIGNYVFEYCIYLTSVTMGNAVTSIGKGAFGDCESLTSITIPNSVTSIGGYAFDYCISLNEIIFLGTEEEWNAIKKATGWDNETGNYTLAFRPAGAESQGLEFTSNGDGTCYVSGIGTCTDTDIVIPSVSPDGETVTAIGEYAFAYCHDLTRVVIPDGVTYLEDYAFYYCSGLTSVVIPDGVTDFGESALAGCTSLKSVNIPTSVTNIEVGMVFYDCDDINLFYEGSISDWINIASGSSLSTAPYGYYLYVQGALVTDLIIPEGYTEIGGVTFAHCKSLQSVTIPDSVTQIGWGAFACCSNLTSVTLPDSVTSIGYMLFSGCKSLTSVVIPDSVTFIERGAFENCSSLQYNIYDNAKYLGKASNPYFALIEATDTAITSCTIHPNTKIIADAAFYNCASLSGITIPDSVTIIGENAFSDCVSLTSITIPANVTKIYAYAFANCISLEKLTVDKNNPVYHSVDDCIIETATRTLIAVSKTSVIPDHSGIQRIASGAFSNQENLTMVRIPDGVIQIDSFCFGNSPSLTSVTLPNSITRIGWYAFYNCPSLSEIIFLGTEEEWNNIQKEVDWDERTDNYTLVFRPEETGDQKLKFKSNGDGTCYVSSVLDYSVTEIEIPATSPKGETVVAIGNSAFSGCGFLTNVIIPNTVKSIGESAFFGCSNIESITIPDSVETIWDFAFEQTAIRSAFIPKSVTSIGYAIFSTCENLVSITVDKENPVYQSVGNCIVDTARNAIVAGCQTSVIPADDSVTAIDSYAFQGCGGFVDLVIPENITSIGNAAFSLCRNMTSIFFPKSVVSISTSQFWNCDSLTSVEVDSENTVYHSANNCIIETATGALIAGCKSSVIPADGSVTSIEKYAFYGCTALETIVIPDSVTSIGNIAFYGCTSLKDVIFVENSRLTEIGQQAFYGCTSLRNVIFVGNSQLTEIGPKAFYKCVSLTSIALPDSVTSIAGLSFYGCTSLTSVTIPNSVAIIGSQAFENCTSLTEIIFRGTEAEWNNIEKEKGWDYDTGDYTVIFLPVGAESQGLEFVSNGDGTCYVSGIGECADTDIVIPKTSPNGDTVTEIGEGAFEFVTSLTSLQIPDSVVYIGDGACYSCQNLSLVTIPNSVSQIGYFAFSGCSSLSEIVFLGAEAEWDAITKQGHWDDVTGDYTLQFSPFLSLNYYNKRIREALPLAEALADLEVYFQGVQLTADDYEIDVPLYDASQNGVYPVLISYFDGSETYTVKLLLTVFLPSISENVSYPTLEEVALEKTGYMPGLPSTGDVEILVIPVAFTNSDYGTDEEIKARLEIAFNGSSEQTGWRSLAGYYSEVSYGALNLHANILDVYQTGVDYDLTTGASGVDDYEYLAAAVAYYDDEIDYSRYDQNGDGTIDCVYLVYLAPYDEETDLWWAYCWEYASKEPAFFDDCLLDYYLWMSIEFFDRPMARKYDPETDQIVPLIVVDYNCETVIHETGHALGLDDYYDYDYRKGTTGGTGGFAMMDENQGDHDPYSKAILGWTNPTVVAGADYDFTLRSFAETGDTVIITKENGGSYFEEYYMIALYTPTGVNVPKKDAHQGLPTTTGVMLWHIDASLHPDDYYLLREVAAYEITLYNNASTEHKLIDLVCADGSTEIDTDYYYHVSDKDLFQAESVIAGLKWYDGTDAGFTVTLGTFETDAETGMEQVAASIVFD